VEDLQRILLCSIGGPCFAAVQQTGEDTDLVRFEFVKWLLFYTLLLSLYMTAAALAMRLSVSASSERLLVMVESRKMKLSVTSSSLSSIYMEDAMVISCPVMLVFLMLIVSPNSLQTPEK